MGPNYANLFVCFVENQIFEQYTDPIPDFFGRFIDDCLGTASCSYAERESFIHSVNNFHPALKFTLEISESSVSFLDILISINGSRLTTSVFYKPTDSHSYLLFSSSHPNHTKISIPFSQFLRFHCICRLPNQKFGNEELFCSTWPSHLSFRHCLLRPPPFPALIPSPTLCIMVQTTTKFP